MELTRRALALSTASLLCSPHLVRSQGVPRRLRLGHNNSTDSVTQTAAMTMAATLQKSSNGRLLIDVSPNSALGTELQMMQAVAEGTLDLTIPPVGSTATLAKEVGLIETPYLFHDVAQAQASLDGALGRHCAELLASKGIAVLSWSEVGLRHVTANRPVRTPADLQGMRIRVPVSQVILESFKVMGANPDTLAFAQLPEALRSGRFEAQENPVNIVIAAQFSRFQSHLSMTGHAYTPSPIIMSTETLEEFPEADRALLQAAARAGAEASRVYANRVETEGLQTLRNAGMTIVQDVDRPAFLKLGGAAMDHLAKIYGADAIARFRSAIA